jgi:hypothetical protein
VLARQKKVERQCIDMFNRRILQSRYLHICFGTYHAEGLTRPLHCLQDVIFTAWPSLYLDCASCKSGLSRIQRILDAQTLCSLRRVGSSVFTSTRRAEVHLDLGFFKAFPVCSAVDFWDRRMPPMCFLHGRMGGFTRLVPRCLHVHQCGRDTATEEGYKFLLLYRAQARQILQRVSDS